MLQWVTDDVVVEVRPDAVARRTARSSAGRRRVAALQYVVQNRGMRRVTVRLDFEPSRHIELVFPDGAQGNQRGDSEEASRMVVDAVVGPLQRRHVVYVVRADGDRAFVRVDYAVVDAVDVEEAKDHEHEQASRVQRWIAQSAAAYAGIIPPSQGWGGAPSVADGQRWCADLNHWSRQLTVRYVDPLFPPTRESLWGSNDMVQRKRKLGTHQVTWAHLSDVVDTSWRFVRPEKDVEPTMTTWNKGVLDQDSWLCAIDVLHADATRWCKQWFGDVDRVRLFKKLVDSCGRSAISVNLTRGSRQLRTGVVVDYFVPIVTDSSDGDGGLACAWPQSGDLYSVLLQKAYAKLRGSYVGVATVPTRSILQELTGRPIVQKFPDSSTRDTSSGAIDGLKAILSSKGYMRWQNSKLMVSFGTIDDHHCAFQLIEVSSSSDVANAVKVRDPTGDLHQIASAKLSHEFEHDEEDCTCVIPVASFARLSPIVFELLADHAYQWRRRHVAIPSSTNGDILSLQVAVSCSSLRNLVLRCCGRSLFGALRFDPITVTIDHVGDDDSWTRLSIIQEHDNDEPESPTSQAYWTAIAGEYVVSLTMKASTNCATEASRTSRDVQANLDLIFEILDHDMDGVVDTNDLIGFLDTHEDLCSGDSTRLRTIVNSFVLDRTSGSAHSQGLTKDDLLRVYETVAAGLHHSVEKDASSEATVEELIWKDLTFLLLDKRTDGSSDMLLDKVSELCCIVVSDHDDVVVASLR